MLISEEVIMNNFLMPSIDNFSLFFFPSQSTKGLSILLIFSKRFSFHCYSLFLFLFSISLILSPIFIIYLFIFLLTAA